MTLPGCLSSIATSEWFWTLDAALRPRDRSRAAEDSDVASWIEATRPVAKTFEFVAIASLEEATGASFTWEPARLDAIKAYLRLFSPKMRPGWFRALDRLLDCTSNPCPERPCLITRVEAVDLVDAYITKIFADLDERRYEHYAAQYPDGPWDAYECHYLKAYLAKHDLRDRLPPQPT